MQSSVQKFTASSSRQQYVGRGGINRIAKRRYTRDLFDDIVESSQTSAQRDKATEDEKIITLLRCFNNFFNKKFDTTRVFKALNFILTKEHSSVVSSWLCQKKADNIYVLGRFILHLTSFMESQTKLTKNEEILCEKLLYLLFIDNQDTLDENMILIFTFVCRKGYFRSLVGFILKNYEISVVNIPNILISKDQVRCSENLLNRWIFYLRYPLTFAVHWRIKVEGIMKAENEKHDLYGSSESLDDDYAASSMMNMSLLSVSSEFSAEEPYLRQTRILLKRIISAWFNSLYFNDTFYQFFITSASLDFVNAILANTVPLCLILLASVEPVRCKRKHSIDSLTAPANRSLIVYYKINASVSVGMLHFIACHVCKVQQRSNWTNVCQEEANGLIVYLHLILHGLFSNCLSAKTSEKKRSSTSIYSYRKSSTNNIELTSLLIESNSIFSECLPQILKLAMSGPLDPDVILPLAYLYQSLKHDLNISEDSLFSYRLRLSRHAPFIRYLWNIISQARTHRELSLSSSDERRCSLDLPENPTIMKMISDGKLIESSDFFRFLSVISTLLECVTFHLNTLYLAESRRKVLSSNGPSSNVVYSNSLLWPELKNIADEVASLSIGLIKIAFSLVNCKEVNISASYSQSDIRVERKFDLPQEIIMHKIFNALELIHTFLVHIRKLDVEKKASEDRKVSVNISVVDELLHTEQFRNIFTFKSSKQAFKMKDENVIAETIKLVTLKQLAYNCTLENKKLLLNSMLEKILCDMTSTPTTEKKIFSMKCCSGNLLFETVFQELHNIEEIASSFQILFNDTVMSKNCFLKKILTNGVESSSHLFSYDSNHNAYPNPHVESFYENYQEYFEFLGKVFAMNILNGIPIETHFAPFFIEKLQFIDENVFNINDLSTIDMEVSKNLMLLSKADDDLECFNFKFVLTQNTFGKLRTYELVKDGQGIPVTNENKNEYIFKVVEFMLDKQIKSQCQSFRKGIDSVFPVELLSILSPSEWQCFMSQDDSCK